MHRVSGHLKSFLIFVHIIKNIFSWLVQFQITVQLFTSKIQSQGLYLHVKFSYLAPGSCFQAFRTVYKIWINHSKTKMKKFQIIVLPFSFTDEVSALNSANAIEVVRYACLTC